MVEFDSCPKWEKVERDRMKLAGKSAIITGGTSGIGEATAMDFAREGASLTIAGRSEAGHQVVDRIREMGGTAQFVVTDISRAQDIDNLFDSHLASFDRLDILFNNASYEGAGKPITETSDEELEKILSTNLKSVFRACRLAAPLMTEAKRGSIINTSAGSAREGLAWANLGAYIASKGAVISLTRALAVELAPYVRVNSLNPGIVDTPMLGSFIGKQDDPDAFRKALGSAQLMQRIADPKELAQAALFLASDDSSYVTGTDLLVDGGLVLG